MSKNYLLVYSEQLATEIEPSKNIVIYAVVSDEC